MPSQEELDQMTATAANRKLGGKSGALLPRVHNLYDVAQKYNMNCMEILREIANMMCGRPHCLDDSDMNVLPDLLGASGFVIVNGFIQGALVASLETMISAYVSKALQAPPPDLPDPPQKKPYWIPYATPGVYPSTYRIPHPWTMPAMPLTGTQMGGLPLPKGYGIDADELRKRMDEYMNVHTEHAKKEKEK